MPESEKENIMNVNWFLNPDNVCCADAADFAAEFEKELGIGGLKKESRVLPRNHSGTV